MGPLRLIVEKEWIKNDVFYDMLLQKAYALDADDAINIKIETIIKTTKDSNNVVNKSYIYIVNGLAIKYTDTLLVSPNPSFTSP